MTYTGATYGIDVNVAVGEAVFVVVAVGGIVAVDVKVAVNVGGGGVTVDVAVDFSGVSNVARANKAVMVVSGVADFAGIIAIWYGELQASTRLNKMVAADKNSIFLFIKMPPTRYGYGMPGRNI